MIQENELLAQAIKYHQSGDLDEAEKFYSEVLKNNPDNDTALYFMGIMSHQLSQFDLASVYIKRALDLNPKPEYFRDLGGVLTVLGKHEEAIHCYQHAIELNNRDIDSLFNLASLYSGIKNFEGAVDCYEKLLAIDDTDFEVLNNLGSLYFNYKRDIPKAIECFIKAITLNSQYPDAHFNLGLVYSWIDENDKAIEEYEKALELVNKFEGIYINLGTAYQEKNQLDKEESYYKKGLELYPENPMLKFNLGCTLIKKAQFQEGWENFESRLQVFDHHNLKLPDVPKYDGSQNLTGKKIYVYPASESFGYGDSMLFARYLHSLSALGAKVVCSVQPGLEKLFFQSDLKAEIISYSTPVNAEEFDYQLPFMSMAHAFKANEGNIPLKEGYLKAEPNKIREYKEKYFDNNYFKAGIFWYSPVADDIRTMSLSNFNGLFGIDGIRLYSLQKGEGIEQLDALPEAARITDLGSTFSDFADTAAAIMNLDLVITPDTSVAHIAGALGKPVFILIPFMPEWRWLVERENTIWYDSARLFRQKEPGNWHQPVDMIRNELFRLVNK